MSKADKKEQRIRRNINNVSLEDFESLVKRYGKILEGSAHPKAHIGHHVYPYKRENPIKAYYVESVLKLIDELGGE